MKNSIVMVLIAFGVVLIALMCGLEAAQTRERKEEELEIMRGQIAALETRVSEVEKSKERTETGKAARVDEKVEGKAKQ